MFTETLKVKSKGSRVSRLARLRKDIPSHILYAYVPLNYRMCLNCLEQHFFDPNYTLPGCERCYPNDFRRKKLKDSLENNEEQNDC